MHQVTWLDKAVEELANIWLAATPTERAAITNAANTIDQVLSRDPHQQGESRAGEHRIFFALPLGANFRIERHAPIVVVTHVWFVKAK